VSAYSNILALATSVLLASDLSAKQTPTAYAPVLQAESPAAGGPSATPLGTLSARQPLGLNPSKTSARVAQPASVSTSTPPFLRQPILFGANSLELTLAGKNALKRAAAWLRQHQEARILIVGSCDVSGSETCTHALAEARGVVIQKFLASSGVDSAQIVGVKGWDNLDTACQTSDIGCQQSNRSARLFMAGSIAP
jgi:outer membrane protein OmpA-like peptidoglycan-associated protein